MALAPAASMYARTPQDMRLLRLLLEQRAGKTITAYYIGIANGEDFYSWLPVGYGTKVDIHWVGIDIRESCVSRVAAELGRQGIKHELHVHDYLQGIPHDLDVVIANRIWETDLQRNRAGLRKILSYKPQLFMSRGHRLNPSELRELTPEDYQLYGHANQCDDYRPEVLGYFWVKCGTWSVDKECPHTRIDYVK